MTTVHDKEKPFEYIYCVNSFSTNGILKRHMIVTYTLKHKRKRSPSKSRRLSRVFLVLRMHKPYYKSVLCAPLHGYISGSIKFQMFKMSFFASKSSILQFQPSYLF